MITVGVVGFFGFFQKIANYNSVISSRLIAAYLAQEGIELVRNIRDNYWLDDTKDWEDFLVEANNSCLGGCAVDYENSVFLNEGGNYLRINTNNGLYSYSLTDTEPTKFKREIIVTCQPGDPKLPANIRVKVAWSEKGQDYQMVVEENLYKWWSEAP